jgi:cell division septation protein DedD
MPEKDDFEFWEPQDPEEEEQQQAATVEQELRQHMHETEPEKPGAPRRLFLLLTLLLVVVGAVAYFYMGGTPAPEAPVSAQPVRQPIALPPPPVNSEEATVKTETVTPSPPTAEAPAASAVKAEVPTAKASVPTKAEEAAASPAVSSTASPTEQAAAPVKAAAAKAGQFVLQAGAFLLKDNLRAAEATVRRLGYEPQVQTVRRTLPMTRLRVGGFFAEEGEAKLASLKTIAPEAFLIRQGEYVLVYAGSYQNIDRARRAADHLYQQGIRVEEEPITAEVSLNLLSFGDFVDRSAAEKAAVQARAAGLEAIVRKKP